VRPSWPPVYVAGPSGVRSSRMGVSTLIGSSGKKMLTAPGLKLPPATFAVKKLPNPVLSPPPSLGTTLLST
jgi:hypothetical protein